MANIRSRRTSAIPSPSPHVSETSNISQMVIEEINLNEDRISDDDLELLKRMCQYTSVVLENKGSVARDHLSNERTILAWIRTALITLTMSLGYLQFLRIEERSYKAHRNNTSELVVFGPRYHSIHYYGGLISIISCGLGLVMLIFGSVRYVIVQRMLMKDYFPASRFSIAAILSASFCVVILSIILVSKVSYT